MRRELKLKLARLRANMASLCSPLDPDRKEERQALAAHDDDAFGRLYVPHWCSQTTPAFHHELSGGFDLRGCEIQAYAAPRNHAKTTRALMRIAREICFAQRRRVTIVSASEDLAEDIFEPLCITLAENPRIIQDFGELIKTNDGGAFRTKHDVIFESKGRDQRLRGPRNDLIVLDDIEDDKQAKSKDRTDALLDIVFEVLYNRLHPISAGGSTFIWLGTILGRKSALARVLNLNNAPDPEYPDVIGNIWRAIMKDDDGHEYSLWPERFPLAELHAIRNRIGSRRFQKEYQNDPRDADSVFQESWIRGFHPVEFAELLKTSAA